MKFLFNLAALVATAAALLALATASPLQHHHAVRSGEWVRPDAHTAVGAEVPAHLPHRIVLSLRQRNVNVLKARFEAAADPTHTDYSKHMTHGEMRALIAPLDDDVLELQHYLFTNGALSCELTRTGDAMTVMMPVSAVNKLFGVTLQTFRRTYHTERHILRSAHTHTLPVASPLARHVEMVHGVSDFPPPTRMTVHDINEYMNAEVVKPTPSLIDDTLVAAANAQVDSARVMSVEEYTASQIHPCAGPPFAPQAAPFPARAAGSSAPMVYCGASRTGAKSLSVTFSPFCPDGKIARVNPAGQLCNGLMDGTVLMTSARENGSHKKTVHAKVACRATDMADGRVACSAAMPVSEYGVPLVITVAIQYASNGATSMSQPTTLPFPVVATPLVEPTTLYDLYKVPRSELTKPSPANITGSVAEFESQFMSFSDLAQFRQRFKLPPSAVRIVGPNYPHHQGGEANLDIQWMSAMSPQTPMVFWSILANGTQEVDHVITWTTQVLASKNPPSVTSLSYGMSERHVDKYLGAGYVVRSETEFVKMAVLGLTVIFSSGDTGCGSLGKPPMSELTCSDGLNPSWPANSPHVTAVSSTYMTRFATPDCVGPNATDCSHRSMGETAVSLRNGIFWTTGGGFSMAQDAPKWQAAEVKNYVRQHARNVPLDQYNSRGRGFPDVSSVGHGLIVYIKGKPTPVDGTSASAPIFAGLIQLITNARVRAGKRPLGFLNPWLYKMSRDTPSAFYDVTVGQNECGAYNFQTLCCAEGFHAAKGWDAVTGLGTMQFPPALASALAMK